MCSGQASPLEPRQYLLSPSLPSTAGCEQRASARVNIVTNNSCRTSLRPMSLVLQQGSVHLNRAAPEFILQNWQNGSWCRQVGQVYQEHTCPLPLPVPFPCFPRFVTTVNNGEGRASSQPLPQGGLRWGGAPHLPQSTSFAAALRFIEISDEELVSTGTRSRRTASVATTTFPVSRSLWRVRFSNVPSESESKAEQQFVSSRRSSLHNSEPVLQSLRKASTKKKTTGVYSGVGEFNRSATNGVSGFVLILSMRVRF